MYAQKELRNEFFRALKYFRVKLLLKYYQNKKVKCSSLPVATIY